MGFEVEDDEDDFWGDATTFGAIDSLCKQAEEAHESGVPLPSLVGAVGISPPAATTNGTAGGGGARTFDASYPLHPPSAGGGPAPLGGGGSGMGGDGGGQYDIGGGGGGGGGVIGDVQDIIKAKDDLIGQKESHLKMLRSRLEMSERDTDEMKRKLTVAESKIAAAATAAGVGAASGGGGGGGGGGGWNDGRRHHHAAASFHQGPSHAEVSNAAALAETKAELARLRSQVAFKEEEAEEARRREDDQRSRLQRAEAESMQLAADLRRERRRAAAAEAEASAATGGGGGGGGRGGGGNPKRTRNDRGGEDDDGEDDDRGAGPSKRARGGARSDRDRDRGDDGGAGATRAAATALPPPPPTPPVALVLPPPPRHLARGSACGAASSIPSRSAAGGGAAAFAAIVAVAAEDVRGVEKRAEDGTSTGASASEKTTHAATCRLRDSLCALASERGGVAGVVAAAARAMRAHAAAATAGGSAGPPSFAAAPHDAPRAVLNVLSAIVRRDDGDAALVLRLCRDDSNSNSSEFKSSRSRGARAPRPPPAAIANVPGASGVGALVPHPAAVSARVYALAPEASVADITAAASAAAAGDANGHGMRTDADEANGRAAPPPGALLRDALTILDASIARADWNAAAAAVEFFTRVAAAAPVMGDDGRGVFVAVASRGALEKLIARGGGESGSGGGGSCNASHGNVTNISMGPPASLRVSALTLARMLASTRAFLDVLDRSAAAGGRSGTGGAGTGPGDGDGLGTVAATASAGTAPATTTASASDEGCPLMRAIVACLGEEPPPPPAAVDSTSSSKSPAAPTVSDAALVVLAALSHAGWDGWAHAVRHHRVLSHAATAAEAAFGVSPSPGDANANGRGMRTDATSAAKHDTRRLKSALMFLARLFAEPGTSAAAASTLRRDRSVARRLARIARSAEAHPEAMPRRVGKYFAALLETTDR